MITSSIAMISNALNPGTSKNSRKPEKTNYIMTSGNSGGDVFTSSNNLKSNVKTKREVVVTYDDVFFFDTPVSSTEIRHKR
jgi:hypothetical protein